MKACKKSFEHCIVRHCAPTLAGLKPANMFTYHGCACNDFCNNRCELDATIALCNARLASTGVSVTALAETKNGATIIFVYRPVLLEAKLRDPKVAKYLNSKDYRLGSVESAIACLREHMACRGSAEFPHEIGLFLGYPIDDVCAFIEGGINCADCVGCWCAYSDTAEAQRTWCQYKICTKLCTNLFESGISIAELPVLAYECVGVRAA